MVILMGVRDEELVQKPLTLDTILSLQDIVNTCSVYEANRSSTSAIRALLSQVNAVSAYKKNKHKHQSSTLQQSSTSVAACRNCGREHDKDKCPAADKTCSNCGRRSYWQRSPLCPAINAQCHTCKRVGHYDRCCRSSKRPAPQDNPKQNRDSPSHIQKKTTLTTVSITYRSITANLDRLPDTGADITVIGCRHLEMLQIPSSSLRPPPAMTTLTTDGSSMAPALGTFPARFSIGKHSCNPTVQVHEDVQTPLLSNGHCQELAIISSEFPKLIAQVKHVNRCKELPFTTTT
ncbi:hypothetical protein Pmani_007397 [Petrolisthes manimaculis]|uniref:Peptidase A2 domain-containing protein n=1 Tax=Petrolisthes manimaculis TaxID=1843537 RepID=A0AAE1UET4_9EUCA|nr:hypothetical protein Pmani_007397 [Petrolisthes manimaculis]